MISMSIDFNNLKYLQVNNKDIQQVKNIYILSVQKCKKWSDGWISFSEAQVITLKKTNCLISNCFDESFTIRNMRKKVNRVSLDANFASFIILIA